VNVPLDVPPAHRFPGSSLTLVKEVACTNPRKRRFLVECDCGVRLRTDLINVCLGATKSCWGVTSR
jgi:hypothetical protein